MKLTNGQLICLGTMMIGKSEANMIAMAKSVESIEHFENALNVSRLSNIQFQSAVKLTKGKTRGESQEIANEINGWKGKAKQAKVKSKDAGVKNDARGNRRSNRTGVKTRSKSKS